MKSHQPKLVGIGVISYVLLLAACTNKTMDVEPSSSTIHTVQQHLAVIFRYSGHDYELGSTYTDDFGHVFKLDTLRFFISDVSATDDVGATLATYPDGYLLVDAAFGSNDIALGPLTAGHLHELRMRVGLASNMNHSDPAQAPPPMNGSSMFSGAAASGYCFLQVEGRADSNGDGIIDGSDHVFDHRCTGDAMLRTAAAPVHADLPEGGVLTAWLPVDVQKLLANIDLLNEPSSADDGALNTRLMDQLVVATQQEH